MNPKHLGRLLVWLLCTAASLSAAAQTGVSIQRSANLPDGAPAFDIRDAQGRRFLRIECIWNGWTTADDMAARMLASAALMAAVLKKGDKLATEDLGPGVFNCVVVVPQPVGAPGSTRAPP